MRAALFVLMAVQPPQPSPPPEVRKTVEAMAGEWTGEMTADISGSPPETFPWPMSCRSVALGMGAACTMEGKASIGPLAQTCLVAYAADTRALHLMCVTSMGEVHDHAGRWTDEKTVEFETLRGELLGQAMTETIRWRFPDATRFESESVVAMANGPTMRFRYTARRAR
jgi:hypothetical protein